jgi:hypothetical protein
MKYMKYLLALWDNWRTFGTQLPWGHPEGENLEEE